ncbi:unnamed protein product, partial [Ectocarpus sp. 12 AP-2014]
MEEVQLLFRRLLLLFSSLFALVVALLIGILYFDTDTKPLLVDTPIAKSTLWQPKDIFKELSNMPSLVKKGYFLITETSKHMGPMTSNPAKRFTGNNLACTNCHLKSGTQAGSASWVGIIDRF